MKMVVLEGIVSYIVGLHKYYEAEVLPAETDESSNIPNKYVWTFKWFYSNHAFTPLNLLLWTFGAMKFCWHKFKSICMVFMVSPPGGP